MSHDVLPACVLLCVVCVRYPAVCVFRHHNLRNELFKDLREQLKDTSKYVDAVPHITQSCMYRLN
jgi:hypothetical protein